MASFGVGSHSREWIFCGAYAFARPVGIAVWFAKYSAVLLPVLWISYVAILIAIKLPELYEKNPWFRRGCDWLINRFRRGRHGS